MKWYGVYVPEMTVAVGLVKFCNKHGILSDRAGLMVWYKAREMEHKMVNRFLERR